MARAQPFGNRQSTAGQAANTAAANPPVSPLPTVNLKDRTYTGPAPTSAATSTGKQSGVDLGNRTVLPGGQPVTSRGAEAAVEVQNQIRKQSNASKTGELTTYSDEAAKLMSSFDAKGVQALVDGGKLTKEQGASVLSKGQLTPEDALAFGLGKTVTVQGQAGVQEVIKQKLNERLAAADADLSAGKMSQEDYDTLKEQIQSGLNDADRISRESRSVPTDTASGRTQSRLQEIEDRLGQLKQPIDFGGLYSYLDHKQAADMASSREKERAALESEKASLLKQNEKKAPDISSITTPTKTPSTPAATTPKTTTTNAAINNMIATSPPEVASFLQSALGMLSQRMETAAGDFVDDVDLADKEFAAFNDIVDDMLTREQGLMSLKSRILASRQADDELLAEQQKKTALAQNETERQLAQLKANDEKRKLERSWSKRVESMGNRLSVLGGYGSMNNIRDIEEATTEGAREVAEFAMSIALNDQAYLDRALKIESDHTNTVVQIHRNYADGLLATMDKYNDKIDDIKKLQFGATQRRFDAIKTAKTNLRNDWNKTQEKAMDLLGAAATTALNERHELEKRIREDKRQMWDDTMEYVKTYGTADKEFLAQREKELGLTPGSLSRKTIEELKMMKSAAGAGPAAGASLAWLQTTVDRLKSQFPDDSPNEILMKAAYLADQKFAGTSKANLNAKNSILETISNETGEFITVASVRKDIARIQASSTLRQRILSSQDPEEEMNLVLEDLTKGPKAPFKGDPDGATEFIVGMFEGTDVSGRARPNVEPVSDFWNVSPYNPIRMAPGFTSSKFSFER